MSFCISFIDHDNLQAIIYLVGTEIFGFHQTLQPWQLFKESTYQSVSSSGSSLNSWLALVKLSKPQKGP